VGIAFGVGATSRAGTAAGLVVNRAVGSGKKQVGGAVRGSLLLTGYGRPLRRSRSPAAAVQRAIWELLAGDELLVDGALPAGAAVQRAVWELLTGDVTLMGGPP
jgi:hypothetical protein